MTKETIASQMPSATRHHQEIHTHITYLLARNFLADHDQLATRAYNKQ
jgi:hypothetical protein